MLECVLAVDVEKNHAPKTKRYDTRALHGSPLTKSRFTTYFDILASSYEKDDDVSLDRLAASFSKCVDDAMQATLPETLATPKRPWISSQTIDLINQRDVARASRQRVQEVTLNRRIRISAKRDRAA